MISLRLDEEMEHELEKQSKSLGVSKSALVRKCIEKFLSTTAPSSAWELGQEYFGQFDSGNKHLSQNKRKVLSQKIRAKNQ